MSGAEAFTPDQALMAIDLFLEFGEQVAGSAHQGYFSGGGWAARCLRAHRAALAAQQAAEPVAWLVEGCGDSLLIRHSERFPGVFAGDAFKKRPLVFGDTHAPATPQAAAPTITIDFKMAHELVEMCGGEPCEITLTTGDGHSGKGVYAYWEAVPEEGAMFLGVPDDEARPEATPQAEPVAAFEAAMKDSWQMVDPFKTPPAGSYYMGEHNGIIAALKTVRSNFERHMRATTPPQAVQPKCTTCNGHGLVGGHMQDGSGYGEGCPDCNPEPQPIQPRELPAATPADMAVYDQIASGYPQAVQPQGEPPRCAAVQHSDQMVCDRCKAAWDVNDPEPPECLPASADAELSQAIDWQATP